MRRALRTPFAIAPILGLALLSGCGSGGASHASESGIPNEIVIGAAIAKSGYLVPYDANIAAVEQLVKETNARGGIDGSRIRVISVDNHSEPQQQPIAVQEVIEDGADVLLFSCEAPIAAAGAPIAEENDKLNFTLCSSEPGYGPPYTGQLSFSANRSLISEAASRATFLRQRASGIPSSCGTPRSCSAGSTSTASRRPGNTSVASSPGYADFKNEDLSIASQIAEIKSSDADAINISSYPPGEPRRSSRSAPPASTCRSPRPAPSTAPSG